MKVGCVPQIRWHYCTVDILVEDSGPDLEPCAVQVEGNSLNDLFQVTRSQLCQGPFFCLCINYSLAKWDIETFRHLDWLSVKRQPYGQIWQLCQDKLHHLSTKYISLKTQRSHYGFKNSPQNLASYSQLSVNDRMCQMNSSRLIIGFTV